MSELWDEIVPSEKESDSWWFWNDTVPSILTTLGWILIIGFPIAFLIFAVCNINVVFGVPK